MIRIENTEVFGWEAAIRGMRNPMNSWDKSDSYFDGEDYILGENDHYSLMVQNLEYYIGDDDLNLMKKLAAAGTDHSKYRRMVIVYADITAPLYWWKEYDTYKVGTVANSCSTMHKIHEKEFTKEDFSIENLMDLDINPLKERQEAPCMHDFAQCMKWTIHELNLARKLYLATKDKKYWWQMIQLLPSSYNQRRTVMLNYEVLANQYTSRNSHKLDEWHDYCEWIEGLPYSEIITLKEDKENGK